MANSTPKTVKEKVEALMEYLGTNVEEGTKEVLELMAKEVGWSKWANMEAETLREKAKKEERQRIREVVEEIPDAPHVHNPELAGHVERVAVLKTIGV